MDDHVALYQQQTGSETDAFTKSRYAQFAKLLPPGPLNAQDVGCNTGRGAAALKARRPNIMLFGLDLLQSRLDRLPRNVYAGAVCGSAMQAPIDDETYDATVTGEFIKHLLPIDAVRLAADAFRILKVGGRLLLTTPNPGDAKRRWRGGTALGGAHLPQRYPDTSKIMLKMYGFAQVRIRGKGKVSCYVGDRFPWLGFHGSCLASGGEF
jgi:SAM-dependent methyltransferase